METHMVMRGIRHTEDTRDPEWCCAFWTQATVPINPFFIKLEPKLCTLD